MEFVTRNGGSRLTPNRRLGCPQPAQAVSVPEEPSKCDQGMAVLDFAGVERGLEFGQRLDDDADVFVLFLQAVHSGREGRIDASAEQQLL